MIEVIREWHFKIERGKEKLETEPERTFSKESLEAYAEFVDKINRQLTNEILQEGFRHNEPINYLEADLTIKGKNVLSEL